MTANQQQTKMQPPYIGSKISLISKLDIRYEGTLYTVDPIESTIALAKVHSYGTEDRRTPVFVPPRDEVYDFIIFKASDIKDLIVCEQPKASNPHNTFSSGLPYDPAIVSISKNPPPEPKLPPKLNMMNACGGVNLRGTNEGGGVGEQLGNRPSFEQLLGPMRFNYRFPNFQAQQPRTKHPSGLKTNNEGLPQVFDNDYDFEKANEQFREKIIEDLKDSVEQLEVKEVVADEPTADDKALVVKDEAMAETKTDEYYNKSQSFFDCISCDALEKESGKNVRPDWKRERQTNQETFGHTAVRNLFYQHRGARGYGSSMALHRNNYRYAPSVQPLMPAYSYRYHAQNNFQRNGRQQMIGGGVGGSGGYRQQQQY